LKLGCLEGGRNRELAVTFDWVIGFRQEMARWKRIQKTHLSSSRVLKLVKGIVHKLRSKIFLESFLTSNFSKSTTDLGSGLLLACSYTPLVSSYTLCWGGKNLRIFRKMSIFEKYGFSSKFIARHT